MRGHGDELSRRGVTSCEMLMIYRYSCVALLSVRLSPESLSVQQCVYTSVLHHARGRDFARGA